jgi:hypothetical protein
MDDTFYSGDLRDFFAGQALNGFISMDDFDLETYARMSYDMADIMMMERERRYGSADRQKQTERLQ